MSLIVHSYDGDVRLPNPNLRYQGQVRLGAGSHHHGGGGTASSQPPPPGYRTPGREYRSGGARRRTRYLLLGATCMIPGLALYFGGGYLFVAAYNGRYPFVELPVESLLVRIFWYIGPIFFFIGLITFVGAYATLCRGIDTTDY